MRQALVSSGRFDRFDPGEIFFPQPETVDAEVVDNADDSDTDIDYSAVSWQVPDDPDADFDALLATQLAQSGESVTLDDDDEDLVDMLDDVLVPIDREWT